jgi:DNA-binding transcriptional MocR family regulator
LILTAIDRIRALLAEMEATGSEPVGSDAELIEEINALASGSEMTPQAIVPASLDMPSFGDGGFPVAAELLVEVAHVLKHEPQALSEPAPPMEIAALAPTPVPAPSAPRETEVKESTAAASSIRVNVDVIENLMTLISELVLTRNQLLQMQRGQKDNEFKVPLQRLSHITSDLQDGVTRMRMQPIGNAWNKLPRIVRDLTVESGKKIELTMLGAETELDRQVLEMIKDPLTHMVRNSADHGIEDGIHRLAIGLGTVTKAFAILERRGLVQSVKGRGTFVASVGRQHGTLIDLSVNTPPRMLSERLLAKTLVAVSRKIDVDSFATYPPVAGRDEHRRIMARWIAGLGMETSADRLILCNGAQQALSVAFSVCCGIGGLILTETATYPGAITLARQMGYRLIGLEMDDEGLLPEALDAALAGNKQKPASVYVTPTMQNPTTATMSLKRRQDIVRICRRRGASIVEDDVYALTATHRLSPISMLAPERSFYVNSLSKTLSPGLRIGALIPPPNLVEAAKEALNATSLMVSPLSCAVMEQWMLDGSANSVRASIVAEADKRLELANRILGDAFRRPGSKGFHIFLPMSPGQAELLDASTSAKGISVTSSKATTVNPDRPTEGVRLCLGGPTFAELSTALTEVAASLRQLQLRDHSKRAKSFV